MKTVLTQYLPRFWLAPPQLSSAYTIASSFLESRHDVVWGWRGNVDTNTVAVFGHLTGGHQLPYCSSTSFRLPWKGSTSTQAELHALFKCCPRQARLLSAARCQTTICCFHLASVLQTVHRLAEQGKQALLGARLGPVFTSVARKELCSLLAMQPWNPDSEKWWAYWIF